MGKVPWRLVTPGSHFSLDLSGGRTVRPPAGRQIGDKPSQQWEYGCLAPAARASNGIARVCQEYLAHDFRCSPAQG